MCIRDREVADGVINCIPCRNPNTDSFGCKEKCEGRLYLCENEIPFPQRDSYTCIRPNAGLEHIKYHAIHKCRTCQENEVSTGCTCYADRHCECPKGTHYVGITGDCVRLRREIQSIIATSFTDSSTVLTTGNITNEIATTIYPNMTTSNIDFINSSSVTTYFQTTHSPISHSSDVSILEGIITSFTVGIEETKSSMNTVSYTHLTLPTILLV